MYIIYIYTYIYIDHKIHLYVIGFFFQTSKTSLYGLLMWDVVGGSPQWVLTFHGCHGTWTAAPHCETYEISYPPVMTNIAIENCPGMILRYPLVNIQKAIEAMAIEIVDLPIENCDFP